MTFEGKVCALLFPRIVCYIVKCCSPFSNLYSCFIGSLVLSMLFLWFALDQGSPRHWLQACLSYQAYLFPGLHVSVLSRRGVVVATFGGRRGGISFLCGAYKVPSGMGSKLSAPLRTDNRPSCSREGQHGPITPNTVVARDARNSAQGSFIIATPLPCFPLIHQNINTTKPNENIGIYIMT